MSFLFHQHRVVAEERGPNKKIPTPALASARSALPIRSQNPKVSVLLLRQTQACRAAINSMAEIKTQDEPALPAKRKSASICENKGGEEEEAEKLQNKSQKLDDSQSLESSHNNKSNGQEDSVVEEDDNEEGQEEVEEEENGEAVAVAVDRKGKGIMVKDNEDSEEDDDDDDDDSSDDDGSELEEDPLAEVDLDNILPSRTRRRVVRPGDYIADDLGEEDDDDSDDSVE